MSETQNSRPKRDLFRFTGEKDTAINLDHVTMITLEATKVFFNFQSNQIFVSFESEDAAKAIYEQVINLWSGTELN